MKLLENLLQKDLETSVSNAFFVLVIYFDSGTLFFAEKRNQLGSDIIHGNIVNLSTASVSIDFATFPGAYKEEFWINRKFEIYECLDSYSSVYLGDLLRTGVIESQPTVSDDYLTVSFIDKVSDIHTIPDYGIITETEFPKAPGESQGKLKPQVFGTVEDINLIPVEVPIYALLTAAAYEDDQQLHISNAKIFPTSGQVVIDGVSYTYSSKSDVALLGVNVTAIHREGTTVALSGAAKYLAAGHPVLAIQNILTDGNVTSLPAIDLANAMITYGSMPVVGEVTGKENVIAEFDNVAGTDSAVNSINAIRAVTAVDSNISTTTVLPYTISTGAVEKTRTGEIFFPLPTQDRIIKGTYTVNFSVNHNGNIGNAQILIGGTIVWHLNGGQVVYNNSPITFFFNEDASTLPLEISRDSLTGSIDLTINSAVRTITLGNLDASAYGLVSTGKKFAVAQSTNMPDRGKITKASIGIEWFTTDEKKGTANVNFNGVFLGELKQNNVSGQTQTENITVDIVNQGNAQLLSNDINKSFAGGTASLSNTVSLFNEAFPIEYKMMSSDVTAGLSVWRVRIRLKAPTNVNTTAFHAIYFNELGGDPGPTGYTSIFVYSDITRSSTHGSSNVINSAAIQVSFSGQEIRIEEDITVFDYGQTALDTFANMGKTASVRIEWDVTPVQQNNTPTFQNVSQSNRNLPNSGITTSHSGTGQNINITIPAPPRTIVNRFDLPRALVDQWPYFTNKTLEVTYSTVYGESLAIVRAVLLIDYDVIVRRPVTKVTATIQGSSENPSDALQALADKAGKKINQIALEKVKTWETANNIKVSRMLSSKTEVLRMINFLAEQLNIYLPSRRGELYPVRWSDTTGNVTIIEKENALSSPVLTYLSDRETDITFNYMESYSEAGFNKVLRTYAGNSSLAASTEKSLKKSIVSERNGGWIRDAATASILQAEYVKLKASIRKQVSLELPYTYSFLEPGDLIQYENLLWRITTFNRDNTSVSITIVEIV